MDRKTILSNIAWGNLSFAARYLSSFLATAFIARVFNPEDFGTYQLVLTYLLIIESFNPLQPVHLRNYLARNPQDELATAASWKAQSLALTFISQAVIWSSYALSEEDRLFWFLLGLASFKLAFRYNDYVQVFLDLRLRNAIVQKLHLCSNLVFNFGRALAAFVLPSLPLLSVMSAAQGFLTFWQQKRIESEIHPDTRASFNWMYYVKLVRGGLLLSIVGFLTIVQGRLFSVILAEKMPAADFGNYQLILRLIEPALTLGGLLLGANYTVLAHTLIKTPSIFVKRFWKISGVTVFTSTLLGMSLAIVPESLLIWIFGESYSEAARYLGQGTLLIPSGIILSVSVYSDQLRERYWRIVLKYSAVLAGYALIYFFVDEGLGVNQALVLHAVPPVAVGIFDLILSALSILLKKTKG